MTQETYNGWTNYETWRVNLEIFDGWEADFGPDIDAYDLGQSLRDSAMDLIFEGQSHGLAQDYVEAFLADVNWYQIAERMIENAKEGTDQ